MCGIAGIVSADECEMAAPLRLMLEAIEHRGPDGAGFVIGDVCRRSESLGALTIDGPRSRVALGHVRLRITGGPEGVQPFQSRDGRISLLHNGEIYNYRALERKLKAGPDTETTGSDSEVVLRMIENEYRGSLSQALRRVLPRLDGVYALVVSDGDQTIIARDRMGVRPLYYCMTPERVGFASEKKPLVALEGDHAPIRRLAPGEMLILEESRRDLERFWEPSNIALTPILRDTESALAAYDTAIREAVRKRVTHHDHVGIIFSGGIDSFLIAYLTHQLGVPFTCYAAGREGSADLANARDGAARFGWDLNIDTLSTDDLEQLIPEIMTVIEDHSLLQVEVAVPIFAAVRTAHENGERVILTGQGADELFGGYSWYSAIVEREGYDSFVERSWEDTRLLYRECLEREDKIAMAHSVELRVPFLDPGVIEVAFRIAPELKIARGGDDAGKRIHREFCRHIGIPEEIAFRRKEAAQHGANIHDAIEEIAVRAGTTMERLTDAGYDPAQTVRETLGSCSRYGYRYGQEAMWKAAPQVQFYLDRVAARVGILPYPARPHFKRVTEKLAARST